MKSMETLKTIASRKSVRSYLSTPVAEADIDKVVIAGTQASCSAKLTITAITNAQALAVIAEETKKVFLASGNKFLMDRAASPAFHALYGAPLLIVLSARKESSQMIASNNIASAACAAENMMLAATELSLGSCYMYGPSLAFENPEIRKLVGMDSDHSALACVIVGRTADTSPHAPRPPAANVRYCK